MLRRQLGQCDLVVLAKPLVVPLLHHVFGFAGNLVDAIFVVAAELLDAPLVFWLRFQPGRCDLVVVANFLLHRLLVMPTASLAVWSM